MLECQKTSEKNEKDSPRSDQDCPEWHSPISRRPQSKMASLDDPNIMLNLIIYVLTSQRGFGGRAEVVSGAFALLIGTNTKILQKV